MKEASLRPLSPCATGKKVKLGIHPDMNTKQENLYFQYEIHILSPTNFFKFTVFYLKVERPQIMV